MLKTANSTHSIETANNMVDNRNWGGGSPGRKSLGGISVMAIFYREANCCGSWSGQGRLYSIGKSFESNRFRMPDQSFR